MSTRLQTQVKAKWRPSSTPVQAGLLQRKCACGNHTIAGGECAECSKTKRLGLQTKLKVNQPSDIYEQEADRIADQVMATPAHFAASGTPARMQRFSGQSNGQDAAPASVDQALARPGRPLEPELRQDMEQRFGYDFSRVRVHSGAAAEQSAQDVNANAYTVGHDVVFGAALFAPGTHAGQRLLAHELTHVVQQGRVGPSIQRAHPGGTGKSARCDYEEGEVAKSHTLKGIVELDVAFAAHYGIRDPVDADAVLISDFGVGDDALKPSTAAELHTSGWIANWDKPTGSPLEVLGYTDCSGGEYDNALLRFKRGQNVAALFPQARPNMKSAGAARMGEFLADNSSARGRALNRSVILRKWKPAPTPVPTPAPTPTPAPEQYVTIKRREPSTEECDKDQRFRLSVAFPAARMMAQYAIEVISGMHKGSEEEAVLIKYFGKDSYAHRWHIKQGYVDTLRAWKRDTTFQCHQQKTGRCVENPNKVTLGYVIKAAKLFGGNIHICERAFKLKDVDLAEVVLHEASHLLDWTTDRQYCNLKTGCTLGTGDAEDNADSYSGFAYDVFNRWY